MKTLIDYVRGYPFVPILLIAQHISSNKRFMLCKEEGHDTFYFMCDDEVICAKRYPQDHFPSLAIKHLNNKKDISIIEKIETCASYKAFVKFVEDQTGDVFTYRSTSNE